MKGPMILAILTIEVLYPMTFPTSFPALLAISELIDGWNDPIASGKSGMIKKSQKTLRFMANSVRLTAIRKRATCIICLSAKYRLTYFTSHP